MDDRSQETQAEKQHIIDSFNGMQVKTSRFQRERSNLELAQNVQYEEIGSVGKKLGYAQRAAALTSTTSTSSSSSTTTSSSTSSSTSTTTA